MRGLLPTSQAEAHLILRQQMPALTFKWKEATWVKVVTLLALGENNFPSHRAGPLLRPGLSSWRMEPQMRCWCCAAAQQVFKTGSCKKMGSRSLTL